MPQSFQEIVRSQMRASLAMIEACIRACPVAHWDAPIAKYPFWHVVYHTLCFVDCYLSPDNTAFERTVLARAAAPFNPQPRGMAELEDEYPSRRFTPEEMLQYAAMCRDKIDAALAAETAESLAGPSGFSWLRFSRAESHLYNLRHIQHHAGQLSASLRRADVQTPWIKAG